MFIYACVCICVCMYLCVGLYLYVIMYTNALANSVNIPHIFNIYW